LKITGLNLPLEARYLPVCGEKGVYGARASLTGMGRFTWMKPGVKGKGFPF